jgi:formylglycine-generating enzyme required for sulfatase activity
MAVYGDEPGLAPFEIDPQEAPSSTPWQEHRIVVVQSGGALVFTESRGSASPLATLRAGLPRLRLEHRAGFWRSGVPPAWAHAWGRDASGPWADVEVASVRVRLRWIPPGSFRMGSPGEEEGRTDHEGPQHDVTISHGFWLFDTPCTQALWEAVMGENGSRFTGADRPVEQVAWDDCRRFLARVNARVAGLDLILPSEAQWEHACRAGTETATYAGAMKILGANNAPVLDEIAWYGGNSGVGFELEEGEDSRGWPEKQHEHAHAGTRVVGRKRANGWGLYDMLGNVWEWVEDDWHESYEGAPADGSAWVDRPRGSARVVRGGSWDLNARLLRAACRSWNAPDDRYDYLGFRCARVQDQAEPASPREDDGAERRSSTGSGATVSVWIGPGGDEPQALRGSASLVLESDRETLELERITKPTWASAIGRDRWGLWTAFELTAPTGTVAQRLRWIPPGRFRMGSPLDEPGRWDYEGPQRDVTLELGFWLFETPCTQALWEAVMGRARNRSRFQTPDRPAEHVSWDDCREFLMRVNERVPELDLVLPSEAQWEYACRAETETATYAGAIEIVGENNAPVLDEIAWYGGNSGVGFELEDGEDSSEWPEKQHEHARAGARVVGRKRANGWGLYDMLGNVWEWVEDDWHESYEGAPADGKAWVDSPRGSARVVRGGSWFHDARIVRAACRDWFAPDDRLDDLGFRCARVQDQVERAGPREDRSAERRSSAEPHESKNPGRRGTRRPSGQKPK